MGRVSPFLTTADCYKFGQGTHYEIYRKLGAHPTVCRDEEGVYFAVWAPMAVSVHVAGSFNGWSNHRHPMTRIADSGIFECFIPGIAPGATYMYAITTLSGSMVMKADPYGVQTQLRPATASVVADTNRLAGYPWTDAQWLTQREKQDPAGSPFAIYEIHPGSWKQGNGTPFLSYRQLAHELADYVAATGYTHVELMGIAEHPFDGSWGYQVTGYYAPTSRHGSPEDFMYLVDHLHSRGIGVILDWVPAHFPKDDHGLAMFDGTPTYEYMDPSRADQQQWGTRVFDYNRPQVTNFLIANALYWVEQYHIDGLRVDAVASMLYENHGADSEKTTTAVSHDQTHTPGTTQPLQERPEAVTFLRRLNETMAKHHPGVIMIAEDSTAWPGVTAPASKGGLGFTFKWNMGWMHDTLTYMQHHPLMRSQCHDRLTFGLTYAFSEQYILPLSHDEVVHLKRSLLSKMPGVLTDQIANLKLTYTFMMGHPGKKLLFMGQDFGQLREWDETRSLDWQLLQDPRHADLLRFYSDLLRLYRNTPALYQDDNGWDGFQWIRCEDIRRGIYSFIRLSKDGKDCLLFVCNFTPNAYPHHRVGVPCPGRYQLILDKKGARYRQEQRLISPQSTENLPLWPSLSYTTLWAEPIPQDGRSLSIAEPLAAYGIQIYRFDYPRH